jgi:thioredoxin 1
MFRLFSTCIIALGIGLTSQADEVSKEAKDAEKATTKVSHIAPSSRVPARNAPTRQGKTQRGKADRIVVYSATWCGPCRRLKPILMSLKNEGYKVEYRDVDKDRNRLTYAYKALPTIYFVRNDTVIKKETGYRSEKHIKAHLRPSKKTNPMVVLLKNTKTAVTTDIVVKGVVETFDPRRLSKEWNKSKKPRR